METQNLGLRIVIDDLAGIETVRFLEEHINDMKSVSPPESRHALDLEGLRKPEITFWTVWDDQTLVGCGALKQLDPLHAEVKSMRTSLSYRHKGIASLLLRYIIEVATDRGYRRLSLETGSMPFFEPARKLYARFGFECCAPFADYREDPNSTFMTRVLQEGPNASGSFFHANRGGSGSAGGCG